MSDFGVLVRLCAATLMALCACGRASAQQDQLENPRPPEVGPDAPPGLRLPRHVQPTAYRALLRVDPAAAEFAGRIEVDLRVLSRSNVIWLHAQRLEMVRATATVGEEVVTLSVRAHGDMIGLRAPRSLQGTVTLALSYRGRQDESGTVGLFRQKQGGDWYSFTHFEPTFGRRVFPSIDEPDRKTPWTVTLEVPAGMTALANTRPIGDAPIDGGWKRVTFATTRPLPSYLVAFAVGPFELASAGRNRTGIPIRIAAPRGKLEQTALAADLLPRALALLEDYFDTPYPYDKLDLVSVPMTVGFSAMENPGLVTCLESQMLFDPAIATPDDRRALVQLAAHELAHQWFGNLVTPAWWNDLWLNEGLATWMEDRISARLDPRPDDSFTVADNHAAALAADGLETARAVRQPIASADDIHSAFDRVTYTKSAAVIAMLEEWIGEEAFQRGLRAYVRRHADGVATTADFLAAIGEAAGRDISGLSTFLDQPSAPRLTTSLRCGSRAGAGGREAMLVIRQSSYARGVVRGPKPPRWKIPFCFAYDRDGTRGETCVELRKDYALILLDTKSCPRWMLPNVGGLGHYKLTMTGDMIEQAITTGWSQLTPVERVVLAREIPGMTSGQQELDLRVALIKQLLSEDNRAAVELASELASMRWAVPETHLARYDEWLLSTFGREAQRLGWLRKPGEPADHNRRRQALVPKVARAGDATLRAESLKLAMRWRALPRDARPYVLRAAVRADATGEIFDHLLASARREEDGASREDLYLALGATRAPDRVGKVLRLLLDPTVDIREVAWLPAGFEREPERTQAETFVRQNLKTLLARYPHDSLFGGRSPFTPVFTGACDARRRDEIAQFVRRTFAVFPGGRRNVEQWIEAMDHCIARKKALGPALERWLGAMHRP